MTLPADDPRSPSRLKKSPPKTARSVPASPASSKESSAPGLNGKQTDAPSEEQMQLLRDSSCESPRQSIQHFPAAGSGVRRRLPMHLVEDPTLSPEIDSGEGVLDRVDGSQSPSGAATGDVTARERDSGTGEGADTEPSPDERAEGAKYSSRGVSSYFMRLLGRAIGGLKEAVLGSIAEGETGLGETPLLGREIRELPRQLALLDEAEGELLGALGTVREARARLQGIARGQGRKSKKARGEEVGKGNFGGEGWEAEDEGEEEGETDGAERELPEREVPGASGTHSPKSSGSSPQLAWRDGHANTSRDETARSWQDAAVSGEAFATPNASRVSANAGGIAWEVDPGGLGFGTDEKRLSFADVVRRWPAKSLGREKNRGREEVLRRSEEKQKQAQEKRLELEERRMGRLRDAEQHRQQRLQQVRARREEQQGAMNARLRRAAQRHEEVLQERQRRAGKETTKVHGVKEEIAFIEQLTAESKNVELQARLGQAEARRAEAQEANATALHRKAQRQEAVRQRRLELFSEKLEKLNAKHAKMFGQSAVVPGNTVEEGEGEVAGGGGVGDGGLRGWEREEAARRREEAARRRKDLEEDRKAKAERVALDKDLRAEEHARRRLEERMAALGAKELRLRAQAAQLNRLASDMQADAEAQREALQRRLDEVVERRNGYMQQIAAKAPHPARSSAGAEQSLTACTLKAGSHSATGEGETGAGAGVASKGDVRGFLTLRASLGGGDEAEGGIVHPQPPQLGGEGAKSAAEMGKFARVEVSKAARKRIRKLRERLESLNQAWIEVGVGGGLGSGAEARKLTRLTAELIREAPGVRQTLPLAAGEEVAGAEAVRDPEALARTMAEVRRALSGAGGEAGGAAQQAALAHLRISGALAATLRILEVGAGLQGGDGGAVGTGALVAASLSLVHAAAAGQEANRWYLLLTGRLTPLVVLLDSRLRQLLPWRPVGCGGAGARRGSEWGAEEAGQTCRVLEVLCWCLAGRSAGQGGKQAWEDSVALFVALGGLAGLERLQVWGAQALTEAGQALQSKTGALGTGLMSGIPAAQHGVARDHLRVLDLSLALLQEITGGGGDSGDGASNGKKLDGMPAADSGGTEGASYPSSDANGSNTLPGTGSLGGDDNIGRSEVTPRAPREGLLLALEASGLGGVVPLLSTLVLEKSLGEGFREAEVLASASGALRVLANVAALDRALLQRMLGSVALQAEFSHVALHLVQAFAASDGEAAERIEAGAAAPDAAVLHELVLVLGYMAAAKPSSRARSVFAGWRHGVMLLRALCALPAPYFASPALREVLLPTLVAATYRNRDLLAVLRESLSPLILHSFVLDHLSAATNGLRSAGGLSYPPGRLSGAWRFLPPCEVALRFHLAARLPAHEWPAALEWFATQEALVLDQGGAPLAPPAPPPRPPAPDPSPGRSPARPRLHVAPAASAATGGGGEGGSAIPKSGFRV